MRRRLIYHCPLPKKKQRVTTRAERAGKPRILSEFEKIQHGVQNGVLQFPMVGNCKKIHRWTLKSDGQAIAECHGPACLALNLFGTKGEKK